MNIVRIGTAPSYEAPGHFNMSMVRLQGREAGPGDLVWLGLSRIAPGGGTTLDASDLEKHYVVIEGEVTISNGNETVTLGHLDSCRIAPGEGRQLSNLGTADAAILLVMQLPESERAKARPA
jgi:mannose-6-phosphate isomerase-like protein (cupin superfamily)